MEPKITVFQQKKLIGYRRKMSFAHDDTGLLWRQFMSDRNRIQNVVGADLYSVEVYSPQYFDHFNPEAGFRKWAAVEVPDFSVIPTGMETLIIPSGLYAVFIHKGTAEMAKQTYQYIFATWLPGSPYRLDTRPHIAIMGEKYKNNDPLSEEEVWIPLTTKK